MQTTSVNTNKSTFAAWFAVAGIALGAFIFNTSEFVPVGLLSLMASDLNTSASNMGLIITIYAWCVALFSLPLMLFCTRFSMKNLMLFVVILFILSHIVTSFSTNYYMLLFSRIGVACAHALFWSIATPLAVRVAPQGKEHLAISFVIIGSSVALLLGIPLGRLIGLFFGWRMSFAIIGILAFLILLILLKALPKMPSSGVISIKNLPELLKTPHLMGVYLITACIVTAHFIAYSYIEPFLQIVANFQQNTITWTLVAYGSMGFLGSYLFSKYYKTYKNGFLTLAFVGIFFSLLMLELFSFNAFLLIVLCLFWGLCIAMFNLAFQSRLLELVPIHTAVAMSIYSGIYNVGIGSGAFFGGGIIELFKIQNLGYFAAILAFIVCIYYKFFFLKRI
ncbi:MAG: sugar transporter [Helicobacteraceae bacterium]|nr:sugar transporter [Helicobacteraceae bacterium]